MSRLTLFLVDFTASDCWRDLPAVLFWHNDLPAGYLVDDTRPGWADSVDPNVCDLTFDGWHTAPFAGPVVDGERVPGKRHDAAVLFRSIVDATQTLRDDCESWTHAAEVACENHGILLVPSVALDIVTDCAVGLLGGLDLDFWAGEFVDALTADAVAGGAA
jgi:hypothetical protein